MKYLRLFLLSIYALLLVYFFVSCKKEDSVIQGNPSGNNSSNGLPVLTTIAVLSVTNTSAISGGNISSEGASTIKARGICWSTSQNPTIALNTKTSDGTGTGLFTSNISGLIPNTKYFVRAYATNTTGTAYGNEVSFTSQISFNPMDVDGNIYTTVTIGSQVWMKENLKTSKYRNGEAISTNLSNTEWETTSSGAYSIYNNDSANNTSSGKLYNWYAVADPRGLCPAGWHVPSDAEWTTLENFLGGASVAGGKMKSTGTIEAGTGFWYSPNQDATNSSGFTGLPGGSRNRFGPYFDIGYYGLWWSSTEYLPTSARTRTLFFNYGDSYRYYNSKTFGFSVRCLRD